MEDKVNPNMIILARESRGLTQTELAKKLGITQGNLSKMEQGLHNVTEKILAELAEVLSYPKKFFFEPGRIYNGISYHRKRQSLPQRISDKIDANANIRSIHIKKLLQSVDLNTKGIPFVNMSSTMETPKQVAKSLRVHWKLPKGPIDSVSKLIECSGIFIIPYDFETKLIDGLSVIFPDIMPIIFVNKDISGDRLRFTLTHELGHILMHDFPTDEMEKEADEFAAEFLMPENEIGPYLYDLTIGKLIDLKRYWKVSMAAILVHAKRLNKITENQYHYLWVQMGRLGYKTIEPAPFQKEESFLVKSLIEKHRNDLGYSAADLSQLLCLYADEIQRLYLEDPNMANRGNLRFIPGGRFNLDKLDKTN